MLCTSQKYFLCSLYGASFLFSGRQQTGQGLYVFPVLRIREVTVGGDPASLAVVPALQPHDVRPGQEHVDVRAAEMDH